MKELYKFRQYLTEGKLYEEAYNLPDSDSNTDRYVDNHWGSILKDILRAHTDLRNSKGGEGMPERPSQLDIDIVLGRFDGADEFMDVDPSVYDGDYFDFYDMYLVTQRDEENTKDISVEDYPEGDYSGYTKRDDLPNLAEGKLLKENKYDIDDPNSPLGQLNDNDQDVAILNNMTKKYGKDVVLMWMSSGEYGDREYFEEGKLLKEEQGYTLYTTNVEYDNGKTGYMYQLVNSEDREENEIGFDQLYFDDEDNRLEMGVDFKDFDQSSYQEKEVSAEEAMKIYSKLK